MPGKLAKKVQAQFPKGVLLPAPLAVLCDYLDEYGYPISGCFEISTRGKEAAEGWFRADKAMQRQFAVFGNGSTGSTYALWLTDNLPADQAPVIVLGSEGEFLVLSVNALEFCRLLGCGYDELDMDDLTKPPSLRDETERLREWLQAKLDVESPPTGKGIVGTAKKRYPGFAKWVRNWQDTHL